MPQKIVHLCVSLGIFLFALSLLGCSLRAKSVTAGSKSLYVELWTNNGCPPVGETVTLRATVTNGGEDTKIVELQQPVLDIILTDEDGRHRWSDGKQLTSNLTRVELKAGESKSIEMQYVVKVPYTGVYAQFIPDAQSIEHPFSPYMVLGTSCPGFIGP